MSNAPNLDTHVPVTAQLPPQPDENISGRPDIPVPTLWQRGVKARRKLDGREAVIASVDLPTSQFRAFYPDEGDTDPNTGRPFGRFASRTEWENFAGWDVVVTFSPKELERQAAHKRLQEEMVLLDAKELAWVHVLLDTDDPAKGLAKLEALRAGGVIKSRPEVVAAALEEVKAEPPKGKK